MGFPPCFLPVPPIKKISQRHHYVKYACVPHVAEPPARSSAKPRHPYAQHGEKRLPGRVHFWCIATSAWGGEAGLRCTTGAQIRPSGTGVLPCFYRVATQGFAPVAHHGGPPSEKRPLGLRAVHSRYAPSTSSGRVTRYQSECFRFLRGSPNRGIYAPLSTSDITERYAIFGPSLYIGCTLVVCRNPGSGIHFGTFRASHRRASATGHPATSQLLEYPGSLRYMRPVYVVS
jgi:hypothetical protein